MIESYSFGEIEIDGKKYTNDVIIFPNHVKGNWWRKEGHRLNPEDIEDVIEASPDTLIVGTGANGRMTVPDETRNYIESEDIDLIVERSRGAVKKFNEIAGEMDTVAAIHLTC